MKHILCCASCADHATVILYQQSLSLHRWTLIDPCERARMVQGEGFDGRVVPGLRDGLLIFEQKSKKSCAIAQVHKPVN